MLENQERESSQTGVKKGLLQLVGLIISFTALHFFLDTKDVLIGGHNGTGSISWKDKTDPILQWGTKDPSPNKTLLETFEGVVQDATRLLYEKSSHLEFWLKQPIPKIYIYDTLPDSFGNMTTVSQCVDDTILYMNDSLPFGDSCRWYPKICSDDSETHVRQRGKIYKILRNNFDSDVALVVWFESYPGRTYDPNEADLFAIPYPQYSHCLCTRGKDTFWEDTVCSNAHQILEANVTPHLIHYNESTKSRHLWFMQEYNNIRSLQPVIMDYLQHGLALGCGSSKCQARYQNQTCHFLVHPYLDTSEVYQPNVLFEQWWWKNDTPSEREYSLVGGYGAPPKGLFYRYKFIATINENRTTIGGKPFLVMSQGRSRYMETLQDTRELTKKGLFCPILPGDSPDQKRIYEVMTNGCIPLLPTFRSNEREFGDTYLSGHRRRGPSIQSTYPYARETHFVNDSHAGIDYLGDLFVTFDGQCGMTCAVEAVERVMANKTELSRLQANLKKYVLLFTHGLEHNRYRYMDGYAAILVSIRHYLYAIQGKLPV